MIGLLQSLLGFATTVFLFFALPLWCWWFDRNIALYFPDYAKPKAMRYMLVGMLWFGLTLYLLWRFVLPDWWIEHTLVLGSDD